MVAAADWVYTVRPGDTLWNIAQRYLVDESYARRVQVRNNITNPRRIPPGTRVSIPVPWLKRQPAPATVVSLVGSATLTDASGQNRALDLNTSLKSGDRVETGADSSVTLQFADGSRFQLRQESTLILDTLSTYGNTSMVDTRMRLQRGRINGQVPPGRGSDTRYRIETPAAVAAVRGTEYRLNAAADNSALRTEVIDGSVSVSAAGRTRTVAAGRGTLTEAGNAPRAPRRLLPPPSLDTFDLRLNRLPIQIIWQAVDGAQGYRVQIAANDRFDQLLFDATTAQPQIRGPSPDDGDYFLRIRAIDELGLEGLDATTPFTLAARPEPPFLMAPRGDEVILAERLLFEWSQSQQAGSYHFQLAQSPDFQNVLSDLTGHTDTRLIIDGEFPEGEYYWRIASIDGDRQGPYSDAQKFLFRPGVAPELELAETEMALQWPSGLPGEQYRFQLARDENFNHILEDHTLAQPSLTLPRPAAGSYYTRVAVIGSNGEEGGFGATQRIDIPNESRWPYVIMSTLVLLLAL
jgi:hypothetical protein